VLARLPVAVSLRPSNSTPASSIGTAGVDWRIRQQNLAGQPRIRHLTRQAHRRRFGRQTSGVDLV
jgi:hypothetical protein